MSENVQPLGPEAWKSLGAGLVIALFVLWFPGAVQIFYPLLTLVHETGHFAVGWLFGYPSIPTFDFKYGGGLALRFERDNMVLGGIYFLFAVWIFVCRRKPQGIVAILVLVAIYTKAAFSNIHEVLVLYMGHGTELLFAALCFFRVFSGRTLVNPAERPFYAFAAFFINLHDFRFAWNILHDAESRANYLEGKGEGEDHLANDFTRIADDFWSVDLAVVVKLFLFCCCLVPVLTFLFYRYEPLISRLLHWLFVSRAPAGVVIGRVTPGSFQGPVMEADPQKENRAPMPLIDGKFFLLINGQKQGPFTRTDLRAMVKLGSVPEDAPCCKKGKNDWQPLSKEVPTLRLKGEPR